MKKLIPLFLIFLLFFFKIALGQAINTSDAQFNQIFLKILSFIHKINYFDQKLIRSKIIISSPTAKTKISLKENLRLNWKLEPPEKFTLMEINDPENSIPYFWHIKLYNFNITSTPLKEEIIPFIPGENYSYSFTIPLSYFPSSNYFFKIELKNSFSNKILKETYSPHFTIEEAKIKLNQYTGYLIKMPIKTFDNYQFLLFTSNQIFFVFSEKINLDSFNNKFVKVIGNETPSRLKNVKVLEILKITSY